MIMTILVLVIIGVAVQYIPMPPPLKTIAYWILGLIVIFLLLGLLGVGGIPVLTFH